MPKISVVVPVYGVENYIERCAISLFEQTLDDIEYIFVNDCTKDKSIKILADVINRYQSRAPMVKIINHTKNQGLPVARQTGIKEATGDYIIHCDSDDWIDHDLLARLYVQAVEKDSDVVLFDIQLTDGYQLLERKKGAASLDKDRLIIDMMYMRLPWSLVNKLVRRELYQNSIEYPSAYMGEDMALSLQLLYYAKSLSYISDSVYYYYVNSDTLSRQVSLDSVLQKFDMFMSNYRIVYDLYGNNKMYYKPLAYTLFRHKLTLSPYYYDPRIRNIWEINSLSVEKNIFKDTYSEFKYRLLSLLILIKIYPRIKTLMILVSESRLIRKK